VLIAEILEAGLATAEDVESRLGQTYLGAVPLLSSVAGLRAGNVVDHVVSKPLSGFSEALRHLRASIAASDGGEPPKVVMVTSSLPGEGKTTTAVTLARSAALQGSRVILLDCDLRRRSISTALRLEPKAGLLEVLSGRASLESVIHHDEISGADVILIAKHKLTSENLFGSPAMDKLLQQLRANYDLVILDAPPVLPVADSRILAPKADAVIFLARWRKTSQHAIEAAFRLLNTAGVQISGVVLTQMDMRKQAKYGLGDPGYYYGQYKQYYIE
jgi:succinoglycan biosynthesis transport protein ExoP